MLLESIGFPDSRKASMVWRRRSSSLMCNSKRLEFIAIIYWGFQNPLPERADLTVRRRHSKRRCAPVCAGIVAGVFCWESRFFISSTGSESCRCKIGMTPPVACPPGFRGAAVGIPFINSSGLLTWGGCIPTGIGPTSSGVTIIMSSLLLFDMDLDSNNFPKRGMLANPGILLKVSTA